MSTTDTATRTELDPAKLDEFVGRFAGDLGSVLDAATVLIGDRLGLYRAMADCGWLAPEQAFALTSEENSLFAPGGLQHWIPALEGVEDKLQTGARVADVGCGCGRRPSSWLAPTRRRASWASTTTRPRSPRPARPPPPPPPTPAWPSAAGSAAGFTHFRRVAETPFNLVFEARRETGGRPQRGLRPRVPVSNKGSRAAE